MDEAVSIINTQFIFLLPKNWNLYTGLIKKKMRKDEKSGSNVSIFYFSNNLVWELANGITLLTEVGKPANANCNCPLNQ